MENIIDCALKNVVDRFAAKPGSRYLRFEIDDGHFTWNDGNQSNAEFGRIVYRIADEDEDRLSDPLVLKCLKTDQLHSFGKELQVIAFLNEIYFYTAIVPIYDSFRHVILFPKFYNSVVQSNIDSNGGIIVFENLQSIGYAPCEKKSILNLAHLRLMVRKLGEFHAFSLKAKREHRDFESIANSMQNAQVEYIRKCGGMLNALCERGIRPLLEDAKYAHKVPHLRELCANPDRYLYEVLNGMTQQVGDVWVLSHGDYLCTNMLFKYEDGAPVDLKIVDMANCRMASPVVDLALMLYMHSDQSTRNAHWDELINEYYSSLQTFPNNDLPSKEQILREFRVKGFFPYFIATYYQCVLIALDHRTPTVYENFPEEYRNRPFCDVPKDVCIKATFETGGKFATECLVNILKDMIDRSFI